MKVNQLLYAMTLDLAARLVPVVPDWRATHAQRRLATAVRPWLPACGALVPAPVPSAAWMAGRRRRN